MWKNIIIKKQINMGKKHIDYLYFHRREKGAKRWEKEDVAGIKILHINLPEKLSTGRIRRIKRYLKGYDCRSCAVGASPQIENVVSLSELQFQARKKELLNNWKELLSCIMERGEKRAMGIWLNMPGLSMEELKKLYRYAKDYYKEVYLIQKEDLVDGEILQQEMYEEWGVLLHRISCETFVEDNVCLDFLLIVSLKDMEGMEVYKNFCHIKKGGNASVCKGTAYLLARRETPWLEQHCHEIKETRLQKAQAILLSGYSYYFRGRKLSRSMALNLAYQCPEIYNGFEITSVAICELR